MATTAYQLSSSSDVVDYPYRAISRAAVISVVLIFLAALGLVQAFAPMLVFAIFGIAVAIVGLRTIARYPDEFGGRAVALIGLVLNSLLLVGGVAEHSYIYATEVPEGYDRVSFFELQQPQHLPDLPTRRAAEIDGKDVFLKGYIHPSSGSGVLKRFILVPDLGTCCFGGQPRSTDMIEVTLTGDQTVRAGYSKLKLAGKFLINPRKAADFDNQIYYQMRVDELR